MPVQRFAPMTKDFATFDCDAHVTEPPLIWERAQGFSDPRRARCAEADDLVGCRQPAADRQWPRRGRARLAAQGRHPRHDAGHHQCRPRRQARHPARPQCAQPQSEDGADPGAGRLSRPCRLLRAEAAPQGHGHSGHRSGHDHPDRDRHLSLAGGRARRQGVLPRLQRVGLRIHAGKSRAAVLCRAHPDAAPGLCDRRRSAGSRRWAAGSRSSGRWMQWATIRCSRNTSRCGTRSKRPAWSTACTRSRPSAARSPPATASSIPAPN